MMDRRKALMMSSVKQYTEDGNVVTIGNALPTPFVDLTPLETKMESTSSTSTEAAITTFNSDFEAPIKVETTFEATQAGSGDPSPSNVRPISGVSSVNVMVSAKNMIRVKTASRTNADVTYTVNDDGTVSLSGTATAASYLSANYAYVDANKGYFTLLKAGEYKLTGGLSSNVSLYLKLLKQSDINGSMPNSDSDTGSGVTITLTEPYYAMVQIYVKNGTDTTGLVVKPSLVLSSESTTFEPYTGSTTTVPLGDTYYGGTLTVNRDGTGTLVVDKAMHIVSTSDDTSLTQSMNENVYRAGINVPEFVIPTGGSGNNRDADVLCNIGKPTLDILGVSASVGDCCTYKNNGGFCVFLYGVPASENTATKARAWLVANNCKIVRQLATPVTYTLTAPQVKSLIGQNYLWTDCGDVAVTYASKLEGANILEGVTIEQGTLNSTNGNDYASTIRVRTAEKVDISAGTYYVGNDQNYEYVCYVYGADGAFKSDETSTTWTAASVPKTIAGERKIRVIWRKTNASETFLPSEISGVYVRKQATITINGVTQPYGTPRTAARGTNTITSSLGGVSATYWGY